MHRKPALILLFIFLFFVFCNGQNGDKDFSPSLTLRTNLFSMLEVDGGIMLGARYQWKKQFAVVLDPTFIFFSAYRNNNTNNNTNAYGQPLGIKIRSDVRYYIDKYRAGRNRFFIAPELHLKYVTTNKWTNFGINCIGTQCDYYMNAEYKEIKNETGAAFKMGAEVYLDKKNLWSFEVYGGFGIKVNQFRQDNIPVGATFLTSPDTDNILGFREGNAIPYLPGSVKLSYKIF